MPKCKTCINMHNHWCEKIVDSPHEDDERKCEHYKCMTQADHIRSMSDEELTDFICSIETYGDGSVKTIEGGSGLCSVAEVEEWLQSEVEVDNFD